MTNSVKKFPGLLNIRCTIILRLLLALLIVSFNLEFIFHGVFLSTELLSFLCLETKQKKKKKTGVHGCRHIHKTMYQLNTILSAFS